MSREEGLRKSLEKRRQDAEDYELKLRQAIDSFCKEWYRKRRGWRGSGEPTYREITEHLTGLGFLSPRGSPLRATSIARLLTK